MKSLASLRQTIRTDTLLDEDSVVRRLLKEAALDRQTRQAITQRAVRLIEDIRGKWNKGLMEVFLVEYGLSTEEGIALMRLAEALLRVPDAFTADALIDDKLAPADWGAHFGKSPSPLVNSATFALVMTGGVLDDSAPGVTGTLRGLVKRLGEPVIRVAVTQVMREMGRQFVLGRTITEAMDRAAGFEAKGYTYSYDMLGEAAVTDADAQRHYERYTSAINAIAGKCTKDTVHDNPGISIKLTALHPRYERSQRQRVLDVLVPRVLALCRMAKKNTMGLTIDAEEADRLDLSFDIVEAVLSDDSLKGWDGFGVVVQAYARSAGAAIDWLYALAEKLDRRITIRLVKGAYWDSEIKTAQVLGIADYPVFTHKAAADLSYLANAKKLFGMTDRVYPQFASHNAQTMASVLELAGEEKRFEFQRLHGMGAALHDIVHQKEKTACRIYAPVGAHSDLLAYLVRRLLENGANSSFVNQIVDDKVPPEAVAADPVATIEAALADGPLMSRLPFPEAVFGDERRNSRGWNLAEPDGLAEFEAARAPFRQSQWQAAPLLAEPSTGGTPMPVENPAVGGDVPGTVIEASAEDVEAALAAARVWDSPAKTRADVLLRAADLYEAHSGEFFALAAREAGKTPNDAVAELREAVDFLRYYAGQAAALDRPARGIFTCISPWNFPLAIFTGQIAAALAAGNGVIAKPAETTPLIAMRAVQLLRDAGVPPHALQMLPGSGPVVGGALTSDPRIAGVCFTGSLTTAQRINRTMAENLAPHAALIAETGGINAMIVDSTALPEQAIKDIVASSFQSAGQRCSALRVLYVQKEIAEHVLEMLYGAMDTLVLGDPWEVATDVGPLIDARAHDRIAAYIARAEAEGRLLHRLSAPAGCGHFLAPVVIGVSGIADVKEEIFGPVLHVATFSSKDLPQVIADINASGYGLTFGVHTRIDERVENLAASLHVGNIYVNRNQIGAVVGSQPFGGEGMSGTGPKAGGPHYLSRFTVAETGTADPVNGPVLSAETVASAISAAPRPPENTIISQIDMPGVTGESNRLSLHPRGLVLCLGPGREAAEAQAALARAEGSTALSFAPGGECDGVLTPDVLAVLDVPFDAVMFWGQEAEARALRIALAGRDGALVPFITETKDKTRLHYERHLCVNTAAAGGNALLLAGMGE